MPIAPAGPEYTLDSLLEIIEQALEAVHKFANAGVGLDPGEFQGWQYEFSQMSRREQARWLLRCVHALTMGEVAWIKTYLDTEDAQSK